MFADDSSLNAAGKSVAAINTKLQKCLQEVSDWCSANMMLLNPREKKKQQKTNKSVVITT